MEVTAHYSYDAEKGIERIDAILNSDVTQMVEKPSIQPRKNLTYSNGFFVNITSLFIDIIGADDLNDKHKSTTIAKIHRSFISECYALLMSEPTIREINLFGDSIWGIFDTPNQSDVESVIKMAGKLNTLVEMLNTRLKKKRYSELSVGIGVDSGRSLMVKAGFSGSGLNDVIWMGDVVSGARDMAAFAGRSGLPTLLISERVSQHLDAKLKKGMRALLINKVKYYGADIKCPLKEAEEAKSEEKKAEGKKPIDDKKAADKKPKK